MINLSIIVPIYNVEAYLDDCLASIQNALPGAGNTEVICVNDGSTDGSEAIISSYAREDSRLRLLTQENGGYGKAINTGMAAARGRFVTIVESDDVVLPGAYQEILKLLEIDDTLDFVKTPYQPFTNETEQAKISVPPHGMRAADILSDVTKASSPSSFLLDRLIFEPPAIWAGVYRRDSLEKYSITLPETPGAGYQDTCFSALCFLNGLKYYWVNDRYYMYRVDRDAASRHSRNRRSEIIDLFDFIRSNLELNGFFTEQTYPFFYALYFRRLIWFMQRVRPDHQFKFFLEAYRAFDAVWADPNLFDKVASLLPGNEKTQFTLFNEGRCQKLYAN